MSAAFRPRFRRGSAETEPEPSTFSTADEDAGDGETGEWLAYEFHEWALESRVMLQQLLTADKVVHSWQGTTLMVHESLEEQVDSLVDEVEEAEKAREATSRPIGPEDALTAFELAEWPEALRAELVERLVQARVPHILDTEGDAAEVDAAEVDAVGEAAEDDAVEGAAVGEAAEDDADHETELGEACDLLVREVDEERVELVIDDLLAREEEAQFEELDGLEVNELLSSLFVACDRLRRDPGDLDGVRGVTTNARRIAGVRTPFGFSAPNWRDLRNSVGGLLDLVESEDADRDDLRELAHRMSDTLRTLV